MEYDKIRNKVNKFYKGGKIQKFEIGGKFTDEQKQLLKSIGFSDNDIASAEADGMSFELLMGPNLLQSAHTNLATSDITRLQANVDFGTLFADKANAFEQKLNAEVGSTATGSEVDDNEDDPTKENNISKVLTKVNDLVKKAATAKSAEDYGKAISGVDFSKDASWRGKTDLSDAGAMGMGIASQLGVGITNAVDELTMGDKNFGAQSAAIDSAVHGVSGALMSSGNPYAMAAGAALEGANFLTKAGGQTVQGFDVNIENSGFGNLGHMESSSSRDFGAMIGLGGLNGGKMQAKLARRNEQARMALQAAEISEDIKFEQEARMNSVDNVLRNNQIALAGGIDTNLLGA